MKKNIKKLIPVLVAVTGLMTTNIIVNSTQAFALQVEEVLVENTVYIDGEQLEGVSVIRENGRFLFPVRAVFEKLGYDISYDNENKIIQVSNLPHFVTFSTTKDGYTFAKMAPQLLGQKPIVKDGISYVPVELLSDIMGIDASIQGSSLFLNTDGIEENVQQVSRVEVIDIDREVNTITVNDTERGTIVLNIEEFVSEDIEFIMGQTLDVEYGDIMTASEPPINTPKSINIVDKISYGEVIGIEIDQEGNMQILFDDTERGEILLNLSKEFIENMQVEIGQRLEVILGDTMTMSLPPVNNPKSVKVVESLESTDNIFKGVATITSIDKEDNKITIEDIEIGTVVLNLYTDLIVLDEDGELVEGSEWIEKGQQLEVEYSPVMTKSLPPINNPISITVLR